MPWWIEAISIDLTGNDIVGDRQAKLAAQAISSRGKVHVSFAFL